MLVKLFGHRGSVRIFTQIIHKYFKSSNATSAVPRTSPKSPLYRHLHVNYGDYTPATEKFDMFSAELRTCRDQNWWESPSTLPDMETCSDDDAVASFHAEEHPKHSLSIREIRNRMNSAQSTASNLEGPLEFEPGLKFLDGIRGGWKDMEMFID